MLRRLPRHERPHRLDVIGAVLVMAASSSFMLALNLGGVRYPWLSLPVIALLVCALTLGAGFVARLRTAVEPLIPIHILSNRACGLAIACHAKKLAPPVSDVNRLPASVTQFSSDCLFRRPCRRHNSEFNSD